MLDEVDAEELMEITDPEEQEAFIEAHKRPFIDNIEYNEKMYGYTKNGRVFLRFGDRVLVSCIGAYPDRRQIDFALVRKL